MTSSLPRRRSRVRNPSPAPESTHKVAAIFLTSRCLLGKPGGTLIHGFRESGSVSVFQCEESWERRSGGRIPWNLFAAGSSIEVDARRSFRIQDSPASTQPRTRTPNRGTNRGIVRTLPNRHRHKGKPPTVETCRIREGGFRRHIPAIHRRVRTGINRPERTGAKPMTG